MIDKALEKHINEIIRLQTAIEKSNSRYLKNDYGKAVHRLKRELKEYCYLRKYNYKAIVRKYNI